MIVAGNFFFERFGSSVGIEKTTRRVNYHNFIADIPRRLQKYMVNRRGISFVAAFNFFLIRRVTDNDKLIFNNHEISLKGNIFKRQFFDS